jgi:hypothetical protein
MTATVDIPWLAFVTRADPEFAAARRRELEYEMSNGRTFTADPTARGAYVRTRAAFAAAAFQVNAVQVR